MSGERFEFSKWCTPTSSQLSYDDEVWLTPLAAEEITPAWLAAANDMLTRDSQACDAVEAKPSDCRDYFYTDLLSLNRFKISATTLDDKMRIKGGLLPPIAKFVGMMRLLNREGVTNTLGAVKSYPRLSWHAVPTIEPRIADLKSTAGSEFGIQILQTTTEVLMKPHYARRLQRARYVGSTIFRQPEARVRQIVKRRPKTISNSVPRLMLSLRCLTEYAPSNISTSDIADLLYLDPDRIIIALDAEVERFSYLPISSVTRDLSKAEITSKAQTIMNSPERSQQFGAKIQRAYQRHHAYVAKPGGRRKAVASGT